MENYSINSTMKKSISSKVTTTRSNGSAEESGWTAYFEDFYYQQQNGQCDSSFSCRGSNLISDVATAGVGGGASKWDTSIKAPRKLRFKKTRTKHICGDDSLEDTATSPVNSPKVRDVKSIYINPRKREDQTGHCYLGIRRTEGILPSNTLANGDSCGVHGFSSSFWYHFGFSVSFELADDPSNSGDSTPRGSDFSNGSFSGDGSWLRRRLSIHSNSQCLSDSQTAARFPMNSRWEMMQWLMSPYA